ncbi:unnamed protein product [Rotaria sp. Silwood1]|nr:unnamed protein product [Rotaria sp. Silwood1]
MITVEFINSRPKPLALYIFTSNKSLANTVINSTSSGSTCVNDVIFKIAPQCLPFGGVGESGLGNYHGKYSFDTFSHMRSSWSNLLSLFSLVDCPTVTCSYSFYAFSA